MKRLLLSVLLLSNLCYLEAQQPDVNAVNGLALQGYDAVTYFRSRPAKGNPNISATHEGIVYWFSDQANKEAFSEDPSKFLPEYGGWCAYAMGLNGEKVSVDPETYKIKEGRLYLFYKTFLNNTLKKWNEDEETLLPRADLNWKAIKKTHNE
jgi:YHS domain-containing protein